MRYWLLFLLFWILPLKAESFLPGTEDIPLMEGITQIEETASFDNPAERMVLIGGETSLPAKKIFSFYNRTLANLGWVQKKPHYYERGADSLLIEITEGQVNQIQFQLKQSNN